MSRIVSLPLSLNFNDHPFTLSYDRAGSMFTATSTIFPGTPMERYVETTFTLSELREIADKGFSVHDYIMREIEKDISTMWKHFKVVIDAHTDIIGKLSGIVGSDAGATIQ